MLSFRRIGRKKRGAFGSGRTSCGTNTADVSGDSEATDGLKLSFSLEIMLSVEAESGIDICVGKHGCQYISYCVIPTATDSIPLQKVRRTMVQVLPVSPA